VLQAAVFGGIRIGPLSIGQPWRALLLLIVVAGARHYWHRTPPLHERVWLWMRSQWRSDQTRTAWGITAATRLSVLLVGYLAVVSVGYPEGAPPYRVSDNEALNLPLRWDTGWYVNISMEGYRWEPDVEGQQNIAFFPGYPLLTKVVADLLGAQNVSDWENLAPRLAVERLQLVFIGAAVLVSFVSFGWGLVWLYALAREHLDEPATRGALFLMAAYPFAVFFSAAYTESLMLLAVVGAFYHFKRERWVAATAWGLLAGITRPNGFLLSGPLGVIVLEQVFARRKTGQSDSQLIRHFVVASAVGLMPIVGTALYSGFIYSLTGNPFEWREAHTAWGRSFTGTPTLLLPLETIQHAGLISYTSAQPIEALNALGAIFSCALIWPVTHRLGPAYGLFMVLNVGPPLLFGGFLAMGRVTSLLFPMFIYLAMILGDRQRQALVSGFACVQGLSAVLFFTWRVFL